MYLNEDERALYEQNLKDLIDKQEELDTAREEGIKDVAKSLLDILDILDVDTIALKTGLSKEEILKLKDE